MSRGADAASLIFYLNSWRYAIGLFLVFYTVGFLSVGALGAWEQYRARCAPALILPDPVAEEA